MSNTNTGRIFAFITCTRVKWEATVAECVAMEDGVTADEIRQRFSIGWHVDGRTGEITYDDDGSGDYLPSCDSIRLEDAMEENGWIDRARSSTVLRESRNDVRPVVDIHLSDLTSDNADVKEEAEQEIRDALEWLEGGYEDNGDGTFYASETYKPWDVPGDYSYALHFTRKFLGAKGYVETPWHPVKDGGLTL